MQKDFTSEGLRRIIANAPMKKSGEQEALVTRLFNEIEPYLSKGIKTAEEELDFCSLVDVALDEGGVEDQNARANAVGQIYDAIGFTHFWKG